MLNAAVWLGAAIFHTLVAGPAVFSQDMQNLLGATGFPYYSVAISQILMARYFHLQVVCAVIALLHLAAEWLYLGRPAPKFWLGLLVGLFALSLAGSFWLGPRLDRLHRTQYVASLKPEDRAAAAKSFRVWHGVFEGINVLIIGGLAVYLWRVANPTDLPRFVSAVKFRG